MSRLHPTVRLILSGLLFAVLFGAMTKLLSGGSWSHTVVLAVIVGVIWVGFMKLVGFYGERDERR